MEIGEIEKIEPLFKAQNGRVFWHMVKLKGSSESFGLHMNWTASFGDLKKGDRVEYVISKNKLGKDGSLGVNKKGYLLFDKLRKIEAKKKTHEEEVSKAYGVT